MKKIVLSSILILLLLAASGCVLMPVMMAGGMLSMGSMMEKESKDTHKENIAHGNGTDVNQERDQGPVESKNDESVSP